MLRRRHGVVDLRSPLEEVLDAARGEVSYMLRDVNDISNYAVEGATNNVRTSVDIVAPDMILRIEANLQHEMHGDDT